MYIMNQHITAQNTFIFLFFVTVFAFSTVLFTPLNTSAQSVPGIEDTIVLSTNPTYSGPNELVIVSAESFSIDLDIATISWFIDDVLQQQTVGGKIFRFNTGALGSSSKIDVLAIIRGETLGSEQITIYPTDIDVLWQAHTFANPLYKGKREATINSIIAIEVIPHFINIIGRKLAVNELMYSWRVDKKAIPRISGKGKNKITVSQTKPIDSLSIEIEVGAIDNVLFNKRTILIPIRSSELLIYEDSPLLGVLFNKTISNLYSLISQETKFIAYPFAMSLINRNDSHINYFWRLNNKFITLGEDRGSITVSHTGSEQGEAEISLLVENSKDMFQESKIDFRIEFGGDSSSRSGF